MSTFRYFIICCLSIQDTRDIDEKRRNKVIEKIHQSALTISRNRDVKLSEFKIINQDPPAMSEDSIIKATESACKELNLSHKKMISRAYHDSLFMARSDSCFSTIFDASIDLFMKKFLLNDFITTYLVTFILCCCRISPMGMIFIPCYKGTFFQYL